MVLPQRAENNKKIKKYKIGKILLMSERAHV